MYVGCVWLSRDMGSPGREVSWHLVCRGQGCLMSSSLWNGHTQQRTDLPQMLIAILVSNILYFALRFKSSNLLYTTESYFH